MAATKTVTAAVLVIGNEVLSGRTQDANLKFLAERLNALGIRLVEARVIRDQESAIVEAVDACRAKYDYVFTTGGIGPTHDDITAAAVAKAFGVRLMRHPEALKRLMRHYKPEDVNEARLRMADVPTGAELIDNPVSSAPGFQIGNVFVMAGVPRIMQAMFEGLRHRLVGGAPLRTRAVVAFSPEGAIAERFAALQVRHPDVEMGSYPFLRHGRIGTSLVLRGPDAKRLEAAVDDLKATLAGLGIEAQDEPAE